MNRVPQLPLPFGESQRIRIGVEASRERLAKRPGRLLVDELDWVAAVALSTTPRTRRDDDPIDVAAKTALWQAGLDLAFPEERRRLVLLHAAAVLAGQGSPVPAVADRIRQLMRAEEARQADRRVRAEGLYQRVRPLLPKGLDLLQHQKEALLEAHDRDFRCIVNDDLGLGKTIECLAILLLWHATMGSPLTILIGSPTSVAGMWVEHVHRWLPALGIRVATDFSDPTANVVVMPYGRLLDGWKEAKAFAPTAIIFDESHYLKNPETQRAKAAILSSTTCKIVLDTTATMTPNGRPEEAFLQFKLVDRSLEWRKYRYDYCGGFKMPVGGERKVWNTKGSTDPVLFGRLVHRLSFRRTKADLGKELGLPDLARYVLPVPVGPKALALFEKLRLEVRESLMEKAAEVRAEGSGDWRERKAAQIEDAEVFAATTKLRMAVERHKIPFSVGLTKELLADGHRVILFAYHQVVAFELYQKLSAEVSKEPDDVLLGTSDLDERDRADLVRTAQARGKAIVLTYAYCEGITLTAFDRVIMVGRHWIPDKEIQAEARAHRIGQVNDVGVYYPVCRGTLDDHMGDVHGLKENRSQQVLASTGVRAWNHVVREDDDAS